MKEKKNYFVFYLVCRYWLGVLMQHWKSEEKAASETLPRPKMEFFVTKVNG